MSVGGARRASALNSRLIAAYEAALAVAREVTPEAVLQCIVDLARERVVPARYAILVAANGAGSITDFITSGLTQEERASLRTWAEARHLVGEPIRRTVPILLPDIASHPEFIGFPPELPSMKTLLGVPVLLGERVLGTLYLTEREDGEPFDEEDLAALQVLAAHAAAAIDRAEAYRHAEQQRDQLRVILDSLPAGVLMLRAPDGRIEQANSTAVEMIFGAAGLTGVLPVYGRDVRVLDADGVPLTHEQRPGIRALNGEETRNHQLMLQCASGKRMPVLIQAAPLPDTAGACERALLVLQDVTQLRRAEQLKDDFLSLISHEFRTPLTAIHGGAHLLTERGEALDEETRREILADIVVESDRLDRMLANMLTLTAVMAGRLTSSTEPVLVAPLAREACQEVAERTPTHSFRVDVPPDVPPAEGDPALLAQVLRNLYENAAKYSPPGSEIVTTGYRQDATVIIEVADNGIGMDAANVELVFERYHRAGDDPTVRGMGLGLYLSRHLVEVQGGRISASSAGLGQGATFAVTLPIARGWMAAAQESAANGNGTG